jgi:sugar (pentulose or hexulose) kinase
VAAERERLASCCGVTAGALLDHALPVMEWWREHAPDVFGRAAYALDASGFLVSWLTGLPVMDRITRDDYVLAGIDPLVPIPAAREPLAVAGPLAPAAAAAIGVGAGVPVAVGTYDSWVDLESTGGAGRMASARRSGTRRARRGRGLTTATSPARLGRAFLDAVALSARDIVERMRGLGHALLGGGSPEEASTTPHGSRRRATPSPPSSMWWT